MSQRVGTSCNKEAREVVKQGSVLFNGFLGIEFSSSLKMFYLLTLFHYVWGKAPEIWGMFFCQWQAGYEVDPSLDVFEDRSMILPQMVFSSFIS